MDFADSADEASFRLRLRDWLRDNNPGLPTSSTSDEYWAGQARWHENLYDAGFFGLSWPRSIGGQELPSVYDVILDDELAAAGAPPRPSLGYLVQGILEHGNDDVRASASCPGSSTAGSGGARGSASPTPAPTSRRCGPGPSATATTTSSPATRCGRATPTSPTGASSSPGPIHDVPKHKGISAFVVPMDQPGIEQRPIQMINGITRRVRRGPLRRARVPAANMVGNPGDGWRLAMTVVSHEREPGELGYVARYSKLVNQLAGVVRDDPDRFDSESVRDLGWALVEAEMLRVHVRRRLSDRLDGITHGPEGSVDKLLMTWVEQAVGHAAVGIGGAGHAPDGDDTALRRLSLQPSPERHGRDLTDPTQPRRHSNPGTACLMTYDLPPELQVEIDGPIRIVRLNRPDELNATNHELHRGLADLFPQLDADADARAAVITGNGRAFSAGGDFNYLDELTRDEDAAPPDPGRRPSDRHRHGGLPAPDRRGRERSRGRPGMQPRRPVRHRVHGRLGAPRRPPRDGRPGRGRRWAGHVAAADQPPARQGVRPDRRPDPGRARGRRSDW